MCALRYGPDRWRLDYLPDVAPQALEAISQDALAGMSAGFVFKRSPLVGIANDLAAFYAPAYSRAGDKGRWEGVAAVSDGASVAKYGTYAAEVKLDAVRSGAMAEHVLGHMLLERRAPLLIVEFPVFYEHFGLAVGDTVEISSNLYSGRKFYIEAIRRTDRFRAVVRAVEWWA